MPAPSSDEREKVGPAGAEPAGAYRRLEREQTRPAEIRDHSAAWERLQPVAATNGTLRERIEQFAATKRITLDALEELGTRVEVRGKGPEIWLAWASAALRGDQRIVSALKFRNIGDGRRETVKPSTFLQPPIIGSRESLDWFACEGETDAARMFGLVGDVAAIVALPAGALTFKREWAAMIPRGATVYLCHDADEAGDKGARKAADILGGNTLRIRPPVEGGDWCEWLGGRAEFVELVQAARAGSREYTFAPLDGFLAHEFPCAEPLLGKDGEIFLAVGSLLLVYGAEGSGKSTLTVDAIVHLAAGRDWLGIPVPRPVRVLVIENEGPPFLFQQKLAEKASSWAGPSWQENVFVFQGPWGEFSFANSRARLALAAYCETNRIDVVAANPTLGLGVAGSGRPDETQQFVSWLVECGLKNTRAFWLLHHENKAGQISGDWGRHPDTKVQLQADANRPRTKLVWEKTRWATLPTDERPKACLLEWLTETKGYNVLPLEASGASDDELRTRIDEFLAEHPWSSTTTVETSVKGTATRIRALLDGGRYDSVKGPRGATLWHFAFDPVGRSDDGVTG